MDTIANSTVPEGSTETWRDGKRYLWLIGLVVPSLAFVGYGLWVLDRLRRLVLDRPGRDPGDRAGDRPVRGPRPLQPAGRRDRGAGAGQVLPLDHLPLPADPVRRLRRRDVPHRPGRPARLGGDLAIVDKVGLAVSIGCIGGIGINTAHELGHKREANERWLSKIALAQSFYGHFYIEHNRGHHVRVATPEDPASSRMGENFYQFWPRTVAGSLKSAWNLEKKRYARRNQHPFRIGNDVLNAWLMSVVLFGALIVWLGVGILPFLIIQAIVGFSLLEVVNYMEHYGMLRQKVGQPGKERYERVDPSHSWNSNNIATNVLLYHLQRHSDHHANPTRRYQTLRDFEESPVLPTGYAGMIVLSLFPPIYRRVMDKRVLAHFGGDLTRANISPRKRDEVPREVPRPGGRPRRPTNRRPEPASSSDVPDEVHGRPLPGLRLHLRGRGRQRARRASPPAPPGRTSRATGAAPTAASARPRTSSPSRRSRPEREDRRRPRQVRGPRHVRGDGQRLLRARRRRGDARPRRGAAASPTRGTCTPPSRPARCSR